MYCTLHLRPCPASLLMPVLLDLFYSMLYTGLLLIINNCWFNMFVCFSFGTQRFVKGAVWDLKNDMDILPLFLFFKQLRDGTGDIWTTLKFWKWMDHQWLLGSSGAVFSLAFTLTVIFPSGHNLQLVWRKTCYYALHRCTFQNRTM